MANKVFLFGPSDSEDGVSRFIMRFVGSEESFDGNKMWHLLLAFALADERWEPWVTTQLAGESYMFGCYSLHELMSEDVVPTWNEFSAIYCFRPADTTVLPKISSQVGLHSMSQKKLQRTTSISEPEPFWWVRNLYQTREGRKELCDAAPVSIYGSNEASSTSLILVESNEISLMKPVLNQSAISVGLVIEWFTWKTYAEFDL